MGLAWPFVNFISNNFYQMSGVEKKSLFLFFIVFAVSALLISMAAKVLIKSELYFVRFINVLFIFLLAIFHFGMIHKFCVDYVYSNNPHSLFFTNRVSWLHTFLWLLLFLVFISLNWIGDSRKVTIFYSKITLLLLLIPSTTLLYKMSETSIQNANTRDRIENGKIWRYNKPNIYYIILDGYTGPSALKKVLGYNNNNFLNFLKNKNFYIADKSFSNYPMTFMSLASSLDMSYFIREGKRKDKTRTQAEKLIQGNNQFVSTVKKSGYKYIHFTNGFWSLSSCGSEVDKCIPQKHYFPFWNKIIVSEELLETFYSKFLFYDYMVEISLKMSELGKGDKHGIPELSSWFAKHFNTTTSPFFLFAHTLAPHEPWRYNADCSPYRSEAKNIENQLKQKETTMTKEKLLLYKKKYTDQITCLNEDVKKMLVTIEEKDPSAIIIIQGDHGSLSRGQFSRHPLSAWTDADIFERYSILNALKLPKECQEVLYPAISPVNNLRAVLSCVGDKPLALLPDEHFYANYEDKPDFEIVEKIKEIREIL